MKKGRKIGNYGNIGIRDLGMAVALFASRSASEEIRAGLSLN